MAHTPKHVLILGCGRSGTSIFGELFEHLAPYTYYSEPTFDQLFNYDLQQPHAIKVPNEHSAYPPDIGLSFPLKDLKALFPSNLKLFWIVRHPLDTICSLKVGISRNWGHHPRPLDWQEWLDKPLLMQCAHHWNYLNTVGFKQVVEQVEICKFEDMLTDSLGFATKISEAVGLDTDVHQHEIQSWAQRVQNKNNDKFIEAKTSRAYSTQDHKVKVGRWRENMSMEEVEMVKPIIAETAKQFGYLLED